MGKLGEMKIKFIMVFYYIGNILFVNKKMFINVYTAHLTNNILQKFVKNISKDIKLINKQHIPGVC